jgi:hypothetical protein
MMPEQQFDLTPSPRVLRMLGQIDFKPWQCLAELIDNSVDAFLDSRRAATGVLFPQVNVELSSPAEIRAGVGTVKVSDNGPGMSPQFLRDAVRAGFTSNSPIDKLGLFGMGFNVATARLGGRTEVWTSRLEDDEWWGVPIDFDEMERAGSFQAPVLKRKKAATETQSHGTEVVVSKLDKERALYLKSGPGSRATRDKLSRVYNKIIRDLGLRVIVGGTELEGRDFCTWGPSRSVETKSDLGVVPAVIQINQDLGARNYCNDCWVWLLESELTCPSCGTNDHVSQRNRRVEGWVGIQRFFDQTDFGIDLIRNGRVIEERSKSFFSWENPTTGEVVPEYPLEQTHWGGRIVGEVNIDFAPLASHQKDSFDRNAAEWHLVEDVLRGKGPLLPKLRQLLGMPERQAAPLARLHGAYRRGSPPGIRTLVPGDATGRGINEEPRRWAAYFWAGDAAYQSDEKWWEAVLIAEEVRTKGKGFEVPDDISGASELPGAYGTEAVDEQESAGAIAPAALPAERLFEDDPSLSGTFDLPEIDGSPRIQVTSQRLLSGSLRNHLPIEFSTVASRAEFRYDPNHQLFQRSLVEPVDCLIDELAYQFLNRSSVSQQDWPLSLVADRLRQKFFRWSHATLDEVRGQVHAFLDELLQHVTEAVMSSAPYSTSDVTPEERGAIRLAVLAKERGGEERVDEVIERGEFPEYLGVVALPSLVSQYPATVLDGAFFASQWDDVAESLRSQLVEQLLGPLKDLVVFSSPEGLLNSGEERRMHLARTLAGLRLLQAWRA